LTQHWSMMSWMLGEEQFIEARLLGESWSTIG
jgi:hypothetical protein